MPFNTISSTKGVSLEKLKDKISHCLKQGADLNYHIADGSWKGWTPLAYVIYQDYDLAEFLLDQRADPNLAIKSNDSWAGWNLLAYASYKKNEKLSALLIKYGANPNLPIETNEKDTWNKWTPLSLAAYYNNLPVIKVLLTAKEADCNQAMPDGYPKNCSLFKWNFVRWFNGGYSAEMIHLFLDHGVDPHGILDAELVGQDSPFLGWSFFSFLIYARKEQYLSLISKFLKMVQKPIKNLFTMVIGEGGLY